MGKSELALRLEKSIRNPVIEDFFDFFANISLSDHVLNILANHRHSIFIQFPKLIIDLFGTQIDKIIIPNIDELKRAFFGLEGQSHYRSVFGGMLNYLFGKYLEDWHHHQVCHEQIPRIIRHIKPPPKTYLGWKSLREEIQPGWSPFKITSTNQPINLSDKNGFLKLLPVDTMSPRERISRLIQGKPVDRVGFGPAFNFAISYMGGSNIWEFCYDGIASGWAGFNTWIRIGGSDFIPVANGVGAFAVPFPDIHSRYFFKWTLPHDAGFPQFIEETLLKSYQDLFNHGYLSQTQEITKRLTRDMLVMFRELLYLSFFNKRYFGPIQKQFFPYAEGMLSAFDLIPMARGLIPFSRDVRKHKDEIVQAFEFLSKPMTDLMVRLAKITHARTILVGGSRGANSWMSQKDFIETHWPSLKYSLNTIIKAGIIPTCHFDNDWTENMAFFAQNLPKRSCLFHLDQVDLTQVHNLIGDHFCLMGGLKHGFLVLGRPDQIEAKVGEYIRSIGHDGLILASGCEIPIDIPIQNLMAYKKAILKNPLS